MKNKYTNKYKIETGIGLQDVDKLKNSNYFLCESEKYIKGEISIEELDDVINSYYKENKERQSRSEEADKVAIRIAMLIENDHFTFSINQLTSIHKLLFEGLLDHPGKFRTYNFSKNEWVLDGDTVIYGDYRELVMALQYDFEEEKKFSYKGLSVDETIDHLATFIANLWQIHVFEEGNTRTTAVFFIKYLRYLGFDVTNDTFSRNSWYFRNALVRANYSNRQKGINENKSYLIKFLRNLLLGEKNALHNKELRIEKPKSSTENNKKLKIIALLMYNPYFTTEQLAEYMGVSVRTVKSLIKALVEKKILKRIQGKRYGYWKVNIED